MYVSAAGATLDDLIKLMLVRNLELQAVRQRLARAEARVVQAGLRPNPTLEFVTLSDRIISNNGDREQELTFHQPFEVGGQRRRRLDLAHVEAERVRYEVADLERQRTAELSSLAGQALSEAARLFTLERISDLNDSFRTATQLRLKVGDAARYEVNQVEAESARLEAERLRTSTRLDSVMIQIKTLAGIDPAEPLGLRDGQLESAYIAISFEDALRITAEARPDLKAALMAEREAEAAITLARAAALPDVSAILGYKRTATVNPAPLRSSDWQFKFGFSLSLPVFGRNQGLIREGGAALAEARLRRESLERLIRRDVTMAMLRLERARRDVKLYEDKFVPLAQASLKMARLGFDLGELRLADYFLEQRRLTDVESGYVQAKAELFQAKVELDQALGRRVAK